MRNEDSLIRYLASINGNHYSLQRIQGILYQGIDWDYFLAQAQSEGVNSLIYRKLSEIKFLRSAIPENIWQQLESCYYTVAVRNISLCDKLTSILDSFNRAGIDAVLLKGMSLINTVYASDIALRPVYDIDILIRPKDLSSLGVLLKELGYFNSSFYPEDFYKDDTMIDVHWALVNFTRIKSRQRAHRINMDEVWADSQTIEINGQRARILSPEYALIELCLHLSLHHGLQGLMWFVDIARLIEYYKEKIDWKSFIDYSLNYRIEKAVYCPLLYVTKILGGSVPEYVLSRLSLRKQGLLERKVFNLILSGTPLENTRFFFTLTNIESFPDKLFFLREVILPSPKTLIAKYHILSVLQLPRYYLIHFYSILTSILKLLQIK